MQRRRAYLGKILKVLFLVQATQPTVYGLLFRTCKLLGKDFDALVHTVARTFPPTRQPETQGSRSDQGTLFQHIRRRPSAPLLAMLAYRVRAGEAISRRLPPSVTHAGRLANSHTHWLLPVTSYDLDALIPVLRREGFDAARATSNIAAVGAPPSHPDCTPTAAARMMSHIVFLPAYPELTGEAMGRLIRAVNEFAGARNAG